MNIKHFDMRWATRSVRAAAVVGLGLAALGASACGSAAARQGQAPSYLILDQLALEGGGGNSSASDVQHDNGSITEDLGNAIFRAAMRDVTNPNEPTSNNQITITRYHVSFSRSDGRNTPGVDVPYAFDGAVTGTVGPGGSLILRFVAVRIQAKLEQPLAGLRGHAEAGVISTIAEITFYGKDQAGREVSVTGLTSINFADWAG